MQASPHKDIEFEPSRGPMSWLLDTNILSELRRPRPEAKVLAFIETLPLDEIYVSVVTLAEPRFGIEIAADTTTGGFERLDDQHHSTDGQSTFRFRRSEPVAHGFVKKNQIPSEVRSRLG